MKGSAANQFGVDLSHILFGTHNSFGVPYEIVLRCTDKKEKAKPVVEVSEYSDDIEIRQLINDILSNKDFDAITLKKALAEDTVRHVRVKHPEV